MIAGLLLTYASQRGLFQTADMVLVHVIEHVVELNALGPAAERLRRTCKEASHRADRHQERNPDQASQRIDGVDKIDGFEGHRADELVKQWSENYRARNPDKLRSRAEIEQAIALQSVATGELMRWRKSPKRGLYGGRESQPRHGP